MKEVTRWEAVAGTWKELSVEERQKLLVDLRVAHDKFVGEVNIEEVSKQEDWKELSIGLQVFLDARFDDGMFSQEAYEQREKCTQAYLEEVEEVERRIG